MYEVSHITSYQNNDGVHLKYTVTNNGNAKSNSADEMEVFMTGPYGLNSKYSVDQCRFYRASVGEIAVGESKEYDVLLNIVPEMFEKHGFVTALVGCYNKEETPLSNVESIDINITQPYDMKVNGGEAITLKTGETKELSLDMKLADLFKDSSVTYNVADSSVATVNSNVLTAQNPGETKLYAVHSPSGAVTEINVTVTEKSSTSGGGGGTFAAKFTVQFDSMGGSPVESQRVARNTTAAIPSEPTKEGFRFSGWYTDKECTTPYNFETKVSKDLTLYAKWTEDTSTSAEWKNPFTDVSENDWFYDAVKEATETGLMRGTADDLFSPNITMTRAMFATILYRMEGEPTMEDAIWGYPFADVDAESWYAAAVYWARKNGIVQGYSDEEFAPNDIVTREQAVSLNYRYAQYKGTDVSNVSDLSIYPDNADISDYAKTPASWAVANGIIVGRDNIIAPKEGMTRAEGTAIFVRTNKIIQKY